MTTNDPHRPGTPDGIGEDDLEGRAELASFLGKARPDTSRVLPLPATFTALTVSREVPGGRPVTSSRVVPGGRGLAFTGVVDSPPREAPRWTR